MRKLSTLILAVVLAIITLIGAVVPVSADDADACPPLPAGTVNVTLTYPGITSYFIVEISGGSIIDGVYEGWCVDLFNSHLTYTYPAYALCSYGALPPAITNMLIEENLDLVNWIINQDYFGKASPSGGTYGYYDISTAIWILLGYNPPIWDPDKWQEIYDAALLNGDGFVPAVGELCVVILQPSEDPSGQLVAIALQRTTRGDEGLTPGFWKNHLDEWVTYSPEDIFSDVFGVGPGITLEAAVNAKGGGEKALLRHAVAALLNAVHPDIDYALTPAEVIALVANAYATSDFESAKDILAGYNETDFEL